MIQAAGPQTQIHLPSGFSFSSVAAGIKASGRSDLALVECVEGTRAAAVFTRNRVVAAPVEVGREALKSSGGRVRGVIVNSGNANCANGANGLRGCRKVCEETARLLGVPPRQVFPSSTGIIGVPFPAEKIAASLEELTCGSAASEEAARGFAQTIMTTDTRPKVASAAFRTRKGEVKLLGIAKGSGMIHPKLATMLVYVFSDLEAQPVALKRVLGEACDQTFTCISVDGDTSTNDTVLLLASGRSGVRITDPGVGRKFSEALRGLCESLAYQIVSDGEGVQHVIELTIEEARNRAEAMQVARAIAHSPLVKTAWAGADPNWGRILAAIGNSGVAINPARVDIYIGEQQVCRNGSNYVFDEKKAHAHLSGRECQVRVSLGRGRHKIVFWTTDLTAEYVRINADYST
jgi:glutamate N-acetyltransferase / amino-acid N-acetyltransferase